MGEVSEPRRDGDGSVGPVLACDRRTGLVWASSVQDRHDGWVAETTYPPDITNVRPEIFIVGTEDLEVSGASRVSVGVATIHLSSSASLAHRGRVVIREPRPRSLPSPITRLHHHLSTHVSRAGSPRNRNLVTRLAKGKENRRKEQKGRKRVNLLSFPRFAP